MKKNIINIALVLMLCATIFSCKKESTPLFNASAGIYFTDSMWTYTFIDFPGKTLDTVKVPATLFGKTASYDRDVKVSVVVDDTLRVTTLDESLYRILDCKLPADSLKAVVEVEVKYSKEMDNEIFKLFVQIEENDEFPNVAYNAKKVGIHVTNNLIQPANWNNTLTHYFGGTYSTSWYKFILNVFKKGYVPYISPRYNTDPEKYYMSDSEFTAYVSLVKEELDKYNSGRPEEEHYKHDDGDKANQKVEM